MKTTCSMLLLFALAFAPACAPKVNDAADVQAIKTLMDGYFKAASAKDLAALQAVMTDQTILIEPHMSPLVGKEAIGKLDQAFLGAFDASAKGPAIDVRVSGDLAVAYGRYEETITPKDASLAAVAASGHWMASLRRQADGAWKWDWVIANSDRPAPGSTADGADERALLEIERGFTAAATNSDLAYFERHLAKGYVQVVDGKPVNFAAVLADLKAGRMRIDSAVLHDMTVHVVGDAAIVSLAGEATGTQRGKPFADGSKGFDLFARLDGRWRVVYSQMTSIKP